MVTVGRKESKYQFFDSLIMSLFSLLLFWLYFKHCYLTASELPLSSSLLFKKSSKSRAGYFEIDVSITEPQKIHVRCCQFLNS